MFSLLEALDKRLNTFFLSFFVGKVAEGIRSESSSRNTETLGDCWPPSERTLSLASRAGVPGRALMTLVILDHIDEKKTRQKEVNSSLPGGHRS